jgi:hypothetical protein
MARMAFLPPTACLSARASPPPWFQDSVSGPSPESENRPPVREVLSGVRRGSPDLLPRNPRLDQQGEGSRQHEVV